MNIGLIDGRSRVVSRRRFPHNNTPLNIIRAALRRGIVWIRRNIGRNSPLISIFRHQSSPSIPYQRLHHEFLYTPVPKSIPPSDGPRVSYGEDTVLVKVGIVGDSKTGKTSLMEHYVIGDYTSNQDLEIGVHSMDKLLNIHNAKIALNIWDLEGYTQWMAPTVCEDAAAILIVFDLTRRTTLHSVKQWFMMVRQYNKVAIPVLVGTKYDQFIKMPDNLKSLITKQARLYAQAMGAPLLFTSIPYKINVNKVFKIVLARIFDLPCNISKNLNPGEPLVDY